MTLSGVGTTFLRQMGKIFLQTGTALWAFKQNFNLWGVIRVGNHRLKSSSYFRNECNLFKNNIMKNNITVLLLALATVLIGQEQWTKLSPSPTAEPLIAVSTIDSLSSWIMTSSANLLHTNDGGESWETRPNDYWSEGQTGWEMKFLTNEKGWLTNWSGQVFHTQNGGLNWTLQDSLDKGVEHLFVLDTLQAWINTRRIEVDSSSYRKLWRTVNGGEEWVLLTSDLPEGIVQFSNDSTGWNIGRKSVLKTTDGGVNWETVFTLDSMFIFANEIKSEKEIRVLIGHPATITYAWATSIDGGQTWSVESIEGIPTNLGFQITMFDEEHGIAFSPAWCFYGCSHAQLLRTFDGGVSWEEQVLPFPFLLAMDIQLSGTGFAVGLQGNIFYTKDYGMNWTSKGSFVYNWVNYIAFPEGRPASIVSDNTLLLRQAEEEDWERKNVNSLLKKIYFQDELNAWGIGKSASIGGIFKTKDGGTSWTTKHSFVLNFPTDGYFPDTTQAWVFLKQYYYTNHPQVVQTTDGGTTWDTVATFPDIDLNAGWFQDENNWWLAGNEGRIKHTKDGGNTWQNQSVFFDASLNDIVFVSGKEGWVAGSRGTIYYTNDGGKIWSKRETPTNQSIFHLSFFDSEIGMAVGDSVVLLTTDGGETWINQELPVSTWFVSADFVNENLAYIGGFNSVLLKWENETFTVVKEPTAAFPVKCYPNPVSDLLQVEAPKGEYMLSIFDIQGRVLKTMNATINGVYSLPVSDLSNGIWYLQLESDKGKVIQKFSVLR